MHVVHIVSNELQLCFTRIHSVASYMLVSRIWPCRVVAPRASEINLGIPI